MLSFFSKKWKQAQNLLKTASFKSLKRSLFNKKTLEEPICHVLCVDDDRSFCLFMQQLAYSLDVQLDTVYSIQEAKQVIEKNSAYDAFIIDGHLPDGSGFELVAWIRKKKKLTLPIGFVSRIYQDAASFRLLKESLNVNYVLEKPIRPFEVHQLFLQFCRLTSQVSPKQEPFSDDLLADLKISYSKTIADKVERLEKMILDVQKNPTVENLQTLKGEVHKIAGSAGSYGYMAVSDICKNLELDLIKQIDLAKRGQLNHQWLASLDDFFTQIKLNFQINVSEVEAQNLRKSTLLPSVYVVDEDQNFLTYFNESTRDLNFEILTESRPDEAIQTLLAADFYPQILLINAHYSPSSPTSDELIQAFYQKNEELTNIIALMVDAQALEDQVKALQRGMSIVIEKPFLPTLLLPLLDQIPFRAFPLHFKILVIDDDLDICQYILKTLKHTDLEVKAIHDFLDLESQLKNFQPDLILLDVNLSDESGIGILHRLRHEWKYKNMLVGMLTLTQQDDTYLLQKCYESNIDEILFKPLESGVLQRKIAFLFKKKTNEILSVQGDLKIGLENASIFKRYLNELQDTYQKSFPKMLVIFEIIGLDAISSKIRKEVTEEVSKAFESLLRKYEIATHLGKERFALVFQGYDPNFVQLFMRHFLLDVHTHLKMHLIPKADFYMDEALVLLAEGENASAALQRAEELLLLAQRQSHQPIRLILDSSFIAPREVLLFHDDKQTLEFFRNLFKKHGFKVSVLETIEHIPQLEISLPLFILADFATETKGLQLLKKLAVQNQIQIPLLHLSHVPEKEYLQRLLNEVNYFESPFSLIIILNSME